MISWLFICVIMLWWCLVVRLCLTLASPWTVARQASLSVGFSRQEYWSGLLFPSPEDLFHPGIKSGSPILQAYTAILSYDGIPWSCRKVKVAQLCPTLCDPMDYTVHGILQARILEWVAFPFSRGSSQPTQGSNSGLLRCRLILYQLSHKGRPIILEWVACPFSSGSSQPRVSCIAGRFFTNWVSYTLPNFTNLQCNPRQAIQFYCN